VGARVFVYVYVYVHVHVYICMQMCASYLYTTRRITLLHANHLLYKHTHTTHTHTTHTPYTHTQYTMIHTQDFLTIDSSEAKNGNPFANHSRGTYVCE
jgi:hypothetical protein